MHVIFLLLFLVIIVNATEWVGSSTKFVPSTSFTSSYTWPTPPDEKRLYRQDEDVIYKGRSFKYWSYDEINDIMFDLERRFPQFVEVSNAQDAFGISSPGICRAKNSETTPCKQWFIRLTDESLLPNVDRPEYFLSGAVHGDEQVGPIVAIETAIMLTELAASRPHSWARRMLQTRSIIIMPLANSLGYDLNQREERGIDPNRDFPFDQSPTKCMRTTAARAINELFRRHMFQISLTFHSGDELLAYLYGSTLHEIKVGGKTVSAESPDDVGQLQLVEHMSAFGGASLSSKSKSNLPYGRSTTIMYSVHGSFEDWSYGASWDNTKSKTNAPASQPCTPSGILGHGVDWSDVDGDENSQFFSPDIGTYPKSKTEYTESQLRVINVLVETSENRKPPTSQLGHTNQVFTVPNKYGQVKARGHVPRLIRVALAALDVIEPYILLGCPNGSLNWNSSSTQHKVTQPSITPICSSSTHGIFDVNVEKETNMSLSWEVGGSFQVDSTRLVWGPWPSVASMQTSKGLIDALTKEFENSDEWPVHASGDFVSPSWSKEQAGGTRWGDHRGSSKWSTNNAVDWLHTPFLPTFSATIDFSTQPEDTELFAVAIAIVDQDFVNQIEPHPKLSPQSHWVNARTNTTWNMKTTGHQVRGRKRSSSITTYSSNAVREGIINNKQKAKMIDMVRKGDEGVERALRNYGEQRDQRYLREVLQSGALNRKSSMDLLLDPDFDIRLISPQEGLSNDDSFGASCIEELDTTGAVRNCPTSPTRRNLPQTTPINNGTNDNIFNLDVEAMPTLEQFNDSNNNALFFDNGASPFPRSPSFLPNQPKSSAIRNMTNSNKRKRGERKVRTTLHFSKQNRACSKMETDTSESGVLRFGRANEIRNHTNRTSPSSSSCSSKNENQNRNGNSSTWLSVPSSNISNVNSICKAGASPAFGMAKVPIPVQSLENIGSDISLNFAFPELGDIHLNNNGDLMDVASLSGDEVSGGGDTNRDRCTNHRSIELPYPIDENGKFLFSSHFPGAGPSAPVRFRNDIRLGMTASSSRRPIERSNTLPMGIGFEEKKMVGIYSPVSRKKRIERFLRKRKERVWTKRVKYDVRKNFADSRLRVKGRFVKKEDEELLREVMNIA
eukprot:g2802.t1